eukprot:TRINITY_DN23960_c2_g1_i1.p1 TRINITY_DN23960_c2_g1~~TRINITY_DN23960_c2_g1_i1.p1  ORF type:complete len:217 (-),score=40.56 TRINITY_DN23960_c2_g1_i1:163-813(-)
MSKIPVDQLKKTVETILKDSADKKRGFVETIELQIGLKNYDPSKDKRFSGTIRLPSPTKDRFNVCVLGDQKHIDECKKLDIPFMSVEDLKKLNKNKKLVKQLAKKYNGFLASDTVIRQVPRLLGPGLNKAGKFPLLLSSGDNIKERILEMQSTIKFQLKKVLCLGVAIGNVKLEKDDIVLNIQLAINYLISLLKKGWQNIRSLYIKTTMGKSKRIY